MSKSTIVLLILLTFGFALDSRGQGSWSKDSTNGFYPVGAAGSCVFDGKIYVIGGSPYYQGFTNAVQIFNPVTHLWSQGPSLPIATIYLSCNVINGKIYVFGGVLDTAIDSLSSKTVEILDPMTNTWTAGPPMPTARNAHTSSVVNGKVYLFGGYGNGSSIPLTNVDVFDPSDGTWSSALPMSSGRSYFTSCVEGGKIYLMGGLNDSEREWNTVEVFNSDSNSWSSAPSLPFPLIDCASSVVDGKIYVFGGIGEYEDSKALEIFDTSTNAWTIGPDMPTGRTDLTSSEVNGKIYALGGTVGSTSSLNTNEVFTPGPLGGVVGSFLNSRATIHIIPNPATDAIQITAGQPGTLRLFDLLGRERMNVVTAGAATTMDVSHLEPDMYFLRLGNQSAKVEIAR